VCRTASEAGPSRDEVQVVLGAVNAAVATDTDVEAWRDKVVRVKAPPAHLAACPSPISNRKTTIKILLPKASHLHVLLLLLLLLPKHVLQGGALAVRLSQPAYGLVDRAMLAVVRSCCARWSALRQYTELWEDGDAAGRQLVVGCY
jgi:hypothetical protein